MTMGVLRLSDILKTVLAGETVTIPSSIGMSKFYRKTIEDYVLQHTIEPIRIEIAPGHTHIIVKKQPRPAPIENLDV
jgi:hypothetical protein